MSELFQIEPSLSPRLKWMRRHGIKVIDNGDRFQPGDESPETGETLYRYCAHTGRDGATEFWDHLTGWGDTEDEALVALAKKLNLNLWT